MSVVECRENSSQITVTRVFCAHDVIIPVNEDIATSVSWTHPLITVGYRHIIIFTSWVHALSSQLIVEWRDMNQKYNNQYRHGQFQYKNPSVASLQEQASVAHCHPLKHSTGVCSCLVLHVSLVHQPHSWFSNDELKLWHSLCWKASLRSGSIESRMVRCKQMPEKWEYQTWCH